MTFKRDLIEKLDKFQTPFLYMDLDNLELVYKEFDKILSQLDNNYKIFYAVKANSDHQVLKTLIDLGSNFEIASIGEMNDLKSLGTGNERMIYGNPIKKVEDILKAVSEGVDTFAVDSVEEIKKLKEHAPNSRFYIRIIVDNSNSDWPLSKKFGVDEHGFEAIICEYKKSDLNCVGISFHVGSQCFSIGNWENAIKKAAYLWEKHFDQEPMEILNIGGGFPIKYLKEIPPLNDILIQVDKFIKESFKKDPKLVIVESGRKVVGESGVLVASVIGKAKRECKNWMYLDVGIFNGLMESVGDIKYQYGVARNDTIKNYFTIAGPTCDSFDVMNEDILFPDLAIGEKVYIMNAGAYTLEYASNFNKVGIPAVHYNK